jgi:protein TonB
MISRDPPLHESPNRARKRWLAAAGVVVSMHVGSAALALWNWPETRDAFEDMGSPMVIELSELPSAQESADSTPSEAADGAPETPEIDEKLATKSDADLPTAVASPYEAPPELQVAQEQTEKKAETAEDAQPTEAMEPTPPTPAAAPAAEAAEQAPPIIAPDALVGSPAEGSAADFAKAQETWDRAIMAHLGKHKRYPDAARTRRIQGVAQVAVVLDRRGQVLSSRIIKSSGSPVLDKEALDVMTRSAPLPSLPPQMRAEQVELSIPVTFRLR